MPLKAGAVSSSAGTHSGGRSLCTCMQHTHPFAPLPVPFPAYLANWLMTRIADEWMNGPDTCPQGLSIPRMSLEVTQLTGAPVVEEEGRDCMRLMPVLPLTSVNNGGKRSFMWSQPGDRRKRGSPCAGWGGATGWIDWPPNLLVSA